MLLLLGLAFGEDADRETQMREIAEKLAQMQADLSAKQAELDALKNELQRLTGNAFAIYDPTATPTDPSGSIQPAPEPAPADSHVYSIEAVMTSPPSPETSVEDFRATLEPEASSFAECLESPSVPLHTSFTVGRNGVRAVRVARDGGGSVDENQLNCMSELLDGLDFPETSLTTNVRFVVR